MDPKVKSTMPRDGLRGLLASPDFVRLWLLGGIANAMRWVEMLAAALFTFEVTGSGLEVAFVSAARSLPLLCFGALAGVVSEAIDRKRILIVAMLLSFAAALGVVMLRLGGLLQPWHVACAAFVSGSSWATEMATRRRMAGESAGASQIARAVALDSLTGAFTRMIGPLVGSFSYAWLGVLGTFAISASCYLLATFLAARVRHSQVTRKLALARLPREFKEGFAFARAQPTVLAVLGVTMTMNLFAFSYVALVAPIARQVFLVSDALVGALAAAEPLGSLLGGLILASHAPRSSPRAMMIGGSALFLGALASMPLMPNFALACAVLTVGALGLALFSNMQTTLILTRTPESVRSRQMGLITVCIGIGPLGQMLIGTLTQRFGPLNAVVMAALAGLATLAVVALLWIRAERPRPTLRKEP